jgi:carbon-monoxide dehydrogenase medium subunit
MPQVRSRGTVIGCLAQANAGGEVPVVSLSLGAEFEVLEPGGVRRRISASEVYAIESGMRLPARSLIASASFRAIAADEGWGFSEVQLRQGHFALVCCAATMRFDAKAQINSVTIAIGGLTANPYRARRAEQALNGEDARRDSVLRDAAQIASVERPWPARADLHATAEYRSKVAITAVVRALTSARVRCFSRAGDANARS